MWHAVGIEVPKPEMVVATRPSGERWTVVSDERGVRMLVTRLLKEPPELIVLEATDGYELLRMAALVRRSDPLTHTASTYPTWLDRYVDECTTRVRRDRAHPRQTCSMLRVASVLLDFEIHRIALLPSL